MSEMMTSNEFRRLMETINPDASGSRDWFNEVEITEIIRRCKAYEGLETAIDTVIKRIDHKDPDSSCKCQNGCSISYCNNMAILQQALKEQP